MASARAQLAGRTSDLNTNTETPRGARGREEEEKRRKEGLCYFLHKHKSELLFRSDLTPTVQVVMSLCRDLA